MALFVPPPATQLGSASWPHRKFHGMLTETRYAHPDGNNANDGLTWGTAKRDVVSAFDALPSSGGTIYVADGTFADSVNTSRGLWLMGGSDPNYASPPAGWRHIKSPLHVIGVGSQIHQFARKPQALMQGGSNGDRNKPAIWLSGQQAITLENIKVQYPNVALRGGIASDGTTFVDSSGADFRNCAFSIDTGSANSGPGIELGYVYWWTFRSCQFDGNTYAYPITACSIVSGTTARFTIGTHYLVPGDSIYVSGVTPAGYNGHWTVTAVAATTVDADIGTSPAAGSVFGTAQPIRHYRRAAIGHDTVDRFPGQLSCGLIFIEDCNFAGGGFHFAPSGTTSAGAITMLFNTVEGAFASIGPPGLHARAAYGATALPAAVSGIFVQDLGMADAGPVASVKIDGILTSPARATVIGATVEGNATTINGGAFFSGQDVRFNRRRGGIEGGAFLGHTAAAPRTFGAAPVLYTNIAAQNPASWSAYFGGSVVTGKSAPDGTTNAGRVSNSSAFAAGMLAYYSPSSAFNIGDYFIVGVWRRIHSGPSDNSAHASFGMTGTYRFNDSTSNSVLLTEPNRIDDGAWDWYYAVVKITAGSGSEQVLFNLNAQANSAGSVDYAYPLLAYIPAASAPDEDEVHNIARYARSWPDGAPQGSVSTALGQKLIARGGLGVGNSAAATTPGSVVKKMEVFSETGASLGFVPIYNSIT